MHSLHRHFHLLLKCGLMKLRAEKLYVYIQINRNIVLLQISISKWYILVFELTINLQILVVYTVVC